MYYKIRLLMNTGTQLFDRRRGDLYIRTTLVILIFKGAPAIAILVKL